MSGSLGDLTVRFTGDASQLAATISEVQGSLSGLEGVSGKAIKGLQGLDSVSGKNLEQIAKQTRAQGGLKSILDKTSKSLEEKKTKLAEVEKAYNENKPKIEANIRSLKDERSSIDDSIKASRDKIATLREQNAALKSNSKEYRSNIATIQNTTQGIYDQQQKRNDLTAQIQRQQSALKKEEAAYRSAESAVKTASAQYQTLAGSQKEIVRMERALALEETGESLQKFGDSVNTITKPLQVVATGLAAGGVAAAKFAIDFEDNFANVEKTVDGTPQQLEEVKQGIIDLTTTGIDGRNAIPQTTAQLTELAAAGGQLGIETENILEFTETMAQMGTATNLAGEEGAKTLARFMNVTGTSQDQVKNLGSAIVELGNNFATSESEIASLAMRMGSTGSVVGISAQDILGYSTALSSLGMEAEAGGSAVSRIWMDMQSAVTSGGETLAEFAKISGKSSEEFATQWKKDASGAFLDFLTGLSKSEDQVKALSDLGFNNIYDIQALQRLASEEGIQLVTEALQRSNTAWEENIALQEEFDAKAETTASQIQITKNNLVEAGRSIGEAFLPIITDVSSNISDFAQGIANMSDEGKESLVNTAVGLVGVGAAAKVVTGTVKGVGNFVEALGKIGVTVPAFASLGPTALAVAGGITALTAATAIGVTAYKAYKNAQIDYAAGMDESLEKVRESVSAYNELNNLETETKELQLIINSDNASAEEIEAAKQRIEEIKALLAEKYSLNIDVNDDDLDNLIGALTDSKRSEMVNSINDFRNKLISGKEGFLNSGQSISDTNARATQIQNEAKTFLDAKNAMEELRLAYEEGSVSQKEFYDGASKIYEGVFDKPFNIENAEDYDQALLGVSSKYAVLSKEAQDLTDSVEKQEKIQEDYVKAAEDMADLSLSLLANDVSNGDGDNVADDLQYISEAVRSAGLDIDEYAKKTSLAQNGVADLNTAWQQGGATLDNVINDYISASQLFGASAQETAVGAALIANGFNDIESAAATDGGLETVSQQATDLAHSLGMLEGKSISVSAEGDVSVIDDMTQRIEEIQGESVTVRVNAEGNLETITEAGNEVTELDGRVASVRVNAEGNYEAIDEAGNRLAEIDRETGEVTINQVEGETLPPPEDADRTVNDEQGETAPPPEDANRTVNDQQGETLPQPEDASQTVNRTLGKDVPTTTPDASGKANFSLGTYPTTVPDAPGTANYSMGTYPTSAPDVSGSANYSGIFPERAPTIMGTILYSAVFQSNAKGTKNFSGGLAMINDQPGISDPRELVQIGGKGYIFEGKDVIVPLPEHAKVYTASQTKQMMAASGIPRYASGKNNEDWENAKSDREHIRKVTYRIIDPREELEWLEEMKKKFASDAEVIKEIEEQVVEYTREMWASDLENMQYALDMGWQSEEEYYRALAEYRDQNFAPDTQEYRDATLELHKYSVQLIEDADELSDAYIDLHGRLNDWGEMGTSMGAVWQTVNKRNVQAAKDGLITWDEYFEKREGRTEQFLDNYIDYSDDWRETQKKYHNMSANDNAAAIKRQLNEVEGLFSAIGELTDEEYRIKIGIEADLQKELYDVISDSISEWEGDADWHEQQAGVYGWENMNETELDFLRRKYDRYQEMLDGTFWNGTELEGTELNETERQNVLRSMDEVLLDIYQATEDEYDEMLDMAQDRIDETEKALSNRLSALDESWEVEDRAAEKAEVLADLDKYRNAVTIEGRDRYEELQDQLKEIEREETRFAMEQENNAILEQLEAEYEALENEKAKVLQQVRDANLNVAALIEPLEENITNSMNTLGDKIAASIDRIRPSVTFTQNNTNYINDGTDGLLYQNRVFNQSVGFLGG